MASTLPRLFYAYLRPPDPGWGAHYWPMSTSLLVHGVLGYDGTPSTYYEPLYPLFLAFVRYIVSDDLLGVLTFQVILCSIGGVYFFELVRLLTRSALTAGIAAAIYAFYPYLVAQAAALEEVSLLTTLLIACTYHYSRSDDAGHSVVCAVLFGLTLLTRVAVAPILVLAMLALGARRHFRKAFALGGVALLIYLPYALRNYRIDGSVLPTRGGYNLLKSNCKYSEAVVPEYMFDVLNAYVGALAEEGMAGSDRATEKEIDQFYTARALDFVKEHPARFVGRFLHNTVYLFYPRLVPFHPIGAATRTRFTGEDGIVVENAEQRSLVEELVYTASYTPVLLTALLGAYLRRRDLRRDLILYFIVLSFTVVYSINSPATRLRAPMDFVLMFFSACALRQMLPEQWSHAGTT